ncbi:MAG: hypothetical protein HUU01_21345 [Saprospiraceae bacterium]|nr:hypothetical protein [Saprospiraceae bacterium]
MKEMRLSNYWILLFFAGNILLSFSCKHNGLDPLDDDDPIGNDTIPDGDTTGTGGVPCDPSVVYFDLQILPILQSRCAFSGCHNEASAANGVILTSYQKVMQTGDVTPFNLDESDLYEVLIEDDVEDRMPRSPNPALSQDQINLIATWILQGAQNLTCDANAGQCDTQNMSFATNIRPIIQNNCQGCHSGTAPSGGINLSTYNGVAAVATNGRLYGAIARQPGFVAMPFGGNQLPQCSIDKIKAWIDAGVPNN